MFVVVILFGVYLSIDLSYVVSCCRFFVIYVSLSLAQGCHCLAMLIRFVCSLGVGCFSLLMGVAICSETSPSLPGVVLFPIISITF